MSSSDEDRDSEVQQLIEAVMGALAALDLPAMVVEPSIDLADSRSSFAQLCLAQNASEPGKLRH